MFELGFDETAAALGRSEAACRQLASRARAHVRSERPRFKVHPGETAQVADAFFAALHSGDTGASLEVLAETATLRSDGGGRATALLNMLAGAEKICGLWFDNQAEEAARFYVSIFKNSKAWKHHALWRCRARTQGQRHDRLLRA